MLISVAVAIIFSLGIRFMHLQTGIKHYRQLFFLENGTPLMTAMDAYYYLKITDTYLSSGQSTDKEMFSKIWLINILTGLFF